MTSATPIKPHVLVTGAAKRIGRELAIGLSLKGYAVSIHFNGSRMDAQATAEHIIDSGGEAVALAGDLQDPLTPARLIDQAAASLGPLTCLINNAALFEPDEIGSINAQSWSRHLAINLQAPVFLSQAFGDQLPEDAIGNIINIIDQRVLKLNPKFFSYTISKSALWVATRTMAQALAPRIRVNAVGPGPTLPNARMEDEDFDLQKQLTLLERGASPKEIVAAVHFILSAGAMTGQMIVLDGGQHLLWQTPDVLQVDE